MTLLLNIVFPTCRGAGISIIAGADIHIFVFCPINFFWNRLFLQSVNWAEHEYMNICPPNYRYSGASAAQHLRTALYYTFEASLEASHACTWNYIRVCDISPPLHNFVCNNANTIKLETDFISILIYIYTLCLKTPALSYWNCSNIIKTKHIRKL
jgi:hypothetical protein